MIEQILAGTMVVVATVAVWWFGRDERAASPDESYLWYGTRRVLQGQVPLRDFRSYEPGRYWFCAPFEWVVPGIRTIRLAATTFLGAALAVWSWMALAQGRGLGAIVIVIVLTMTWSFRPSKRFDQGVIVLLAAAAGWVIANPVPGWVFGAGVCVGLAAVFGLNHLLYGATAVGGCALVSVMTSDLAVTSGLLYGFAGFALGAVPLAAAVLFVRRFWSSLVRQRVGDPRRRGSTNLPLPYPNPLARRNNPRLAQFPAPASRVLGIMFTALPASALTVVVVALLAGPGFAREHSLLVGSAAVGLVSWHHAFSRADLAHLATVAPAFWIAAATTADAWPWLGGPVLLALGYATYVAAVPAHDRVQRMRRRGDFARAEEGVGHRLWFRTEDLPLLRLLARLNCHSPPGVPWVAVPTTLWILPLADRESAVYNTFCVYPANDDAQLEMIDEIDSSGADVAVVSNRRLDRRDDLRFSATHPLVWEHLHRQFAVVDEFPDSEIAVLRRSSAAAE